MLALSTRESVAAVDGSTTTGAWTGSGPGVTVVVAAATTVPGEDSSPATDPTLLVVGSQDELGHGGRSDDVVPDFSRMAKAFGERRLDVVAPGVS